MKLFYRFFLLSCLELVSFSAMAQDPVMKHYTIDDGLPSNTVYDIYPDSKGYLWFGTDKGVARYNGTNFQKFAIKDGLPDNEIFLFKEDYEGRLWLATWNGKLCYFKNDTFHNEKNTPWLKLLDRCIHIYKINIEQDSSVTFQFSTHDYIVNIKDGQCRFIPLKEITPVLDTIPHPFFIPLLINRKLDRDRYSLLGRSREIIINDKGQLISSSNHTGNRKLTGFLSSHKDSYKIYNDSAYDSEGRFVARVTDFKSWDYYPFLQSGTTHFWGQSDGLHINDLHFLKGHFVTAVAEDFQHNYWAGTLKDGVYILPPEFSKTVQFRSAYQGKIDDAVIIGKRLYYVGKKGDIYREGNLNEFEAVYLPDKQYTFGENPGNRLFAQGYAVLTTLEYLILINNIDAKPVLKPLIPSRTSLKSFAFKNVLFNGSFWGFIGNGVFMFNFLERQPGSADSFFFHQKIKISGRIFSSVQDEHDNIWFAYSDSVLSIKRDNKVSLQFKQSYGSLREIMVRSNFFIAFTDANQLVIFNRNRLPAMVDTINRDDITWGKIIPIDNTHLLLSSDKTYFILTLYPDKKSGKAFELKPVENLFLPKQADYVYADRDYCYFFKNGDILKIATSVLLAKTPTPRVYFTRLTTPSKKLVLFQGLSFAYGEAKNIKLNFEALSFSSKMLSYQYSLSDDGQDNWQSTEGTELNLLVPSYGDYTVKVRAKTISGGYSEPDVINFTIRRPYWATLPFGIAIFMGLSVVVWLLVKWRTHRQQQKFEAEKKFQQSEYKALNALMNPHFIFNSLNNIQGLINEDEKMTANDYLVVFSDMIRQNMHNIAQGSISLQKEINLCRNYLELEKLRFKELVNYRIIVGEEVDTEDIFIPPLMIQPLVENSVKHGLLPRQSPDALVVLRIREEEKQLLIEIEDNGIGLRASAESKDRLHISTGLDNLKQRIEYVRKIHDYEMTFSIDEIMKNGIVQGTIAVIRLTLS